MARIPLGQNTPLTLVGYFSAESGVSQGRDGNTTPAAGGSYITGGLQHVRSGVGGDYALRITTNQGFIFPLGGLIVRNVLVFLPIWGVATYTLNLLRGGTDYQGGFEVLAGNALRLVRGRSGVAVTELARTATGAIPAEQYNWACLDYYVSNTGYARFRLFSYNNLLLDFSGDTQQSATFNHVDAVRIYADGVSSDVRADDIFVFVRTIYFNTAAGTTPVEGDTITDVDTGATALVDAVQVDGTDGVAIVYSITGTFEPGDDLSSGAWTAVCGNHLGNDQESLWIPEGFFAAQFLSSSVASGWSATNVPPQQNWQQVDDWFDLTDYIFTSTVSVVDNYGTTEPATIPTGSQFLAFVVSTWGNNSASITQVQFGYYDGTGTESGPDQVLPSTAGRSDMIWTNNTRTGSPFSLSEVQAMQVLVTSVA